MADASSPQREFELTDNTRLGALQRLTDAALASLSPDALLGELLARVTEILATDTAAILLLDESGTALQARAARGLEEAVDQGVRIPLGRGFAGRVAAERRAIAIEDVDRAEVVNPLLREKGIRSLLGVPLIVEERMLGVLHVGTLTRRAFGEHDAELLQLAADRAAIAVEHATLSEQRRLAELLQRRLLPTDLASSAGLQLASRYLPASGESLGGDWYDAFAAGPGRHVVAIGDVVGHGMIAAAAMAQLRMAVRAYAAEGHPPATVVERVNDLMRALGPRAMTTLVYAAIDADRESIEVVVAGHPPPLVVEPGGRATFLEVPGGVPLGVVDGGRYSSRTFPFSPGTTLVLYTDGLVETRGEPLDVGLERLRAIVAAADYHGIDGLCSRLVGQLVGPTRPDDVALLVARLEPVPARLTGRWPARREELAGVRRLLRRWLHTRGASDDETFDIVVACQEACANAIEHAYRPGDHSFDLEATCDGGRVRIEVRDCGRWRAARGAHRGRGVELMRGLMDEVEIRRGEDGTTVVLERTLSGDPA